jgi:hypothetical protein
MPSKNLAEIMDTPLHNSQPAITIATVRFPGCICRKKKCCNKYKRKGKYCKSCPKR